MNRLSRLVVASKRLEAVALDVVTAGLSTLHAASDELALRTREQLLISYRRRKLAKASFTWAPRSQTTRRRYSIAYAIPADLHTPLTYGYAVALLLRHSSRFQLTFPPLLAPQFTQ